MYQVGSWLDIALSIYSTPKNSEMKNTKKNSVTFHGNLHSHLEQWYIIILPIFGKSLVGMATRLPCRAVFWAN